jgi:hypothetical protein
VICIVPLIHACIWIFTRSTSFPRKSPPTHLLSSAWIAAAVLWTESHGHERRQLTAGGPGRAERLIGDAAKNQAATNPNNTVFDVKRLIERKSDDSAIQQDLKHWPFKVIAQAQRGAGAHGSAVEAGVEADLALAPRSAWETNEPPGRPAHRCHVRHGGSRHGRHGGAVTRVTARWQVAVPSCPPHGRREGRRAGGGGAAWLGRPGRLARLTPGQARDPADPGTGPWPG